MEDIKSKFNFVRSMLSSYSGGISSTRVCIAAVFAFVIGVGVTLVTKIHAPVTVEEFNAFLPAAATFVTTVTAPLYLINKGAGVLNSRGGQPDKPDHPEQGPNGPGDGFDRR